TTSWRRRAARSRRARRRGSAACPAASRRARPLPGRSPCGHPGSIRSRCGRDEAWPSPRLEAEAPQALDRLAQPLAAEREPDVSLAGVAEAVARGDDDVRLLEAAAGEPGGGQAARDRHPDVERAPRRIAGEAERAEPAHQHVAPLAVERAQSVD